MSNVTKKRPLVADVRIGGPGVDLAGLRQLAKNDPAAFMARAQDLIDKRLLTLASVRDYRTLYEATADLSVPASYSDVLGRTRAIMTPAFPLLLGNMAIAAINDRYTAAPTIGEQLVTEMDDAKKWSVVASIVEKDVHKSNVKEGEDYPEIGAGEESAHIGFNRNGRRISVTGDVIRENDGADIISRFNALADIATDYVEELTLDRICDRNGSATSPAEPYAYRPNGTGTQLYNSTANNPNTRCPSGTRVTNNALVDETDLENARVALAAMKNHRGKRIAIPISQCILLVPDALASVAGKTLGSEYTPGVANELNQWGPRGQWRPRLLSSPKLDDISTTAWYLGDFRRQFRRKWRMRMELVQAGMETESYLRSGIAFQARIGWDCEVGAVDCVYVVQSLSATTAPTAANAQ